MQQFDGGEFDLSYYNKGVHKGQIKDIHTPNDLVLTYEYDSDNRIASVNCGGAYRLEYSRDTQGRLITRKQLRSSKWVISNSGAVTEYKWV